MRQTLKSLASYKDKKVMFVGQKVFIVRKDDIISGTLENILPKTVRIDGNLYSPTLVYMKIEDAETRFVRESVKLIAEYGIDWRNLYSILDRLKEDKPHLFV